MDNLDFLFYPEHHQPVEEQPQFSRYELSLYDRWETVKEVRPFNCGLD